MRVEMVAGGNGGYGFVVHAENNMERVALRAFLRQTEEPGHTFALHGRTYDDNRFGPSSFNFGTMYREPEEPTPAEKLFTGFPVVISEVKRHVPPEG